MFSKLLSLLSSKAGVSLCLTLLFVFPRMSFAQGIRDSVFNIKPVQITADYIFKQEEAGMKISEVDSLVFIDKANESLSQLLSENTSVFIKDYGRGALATASFRGTAASHTQVRWNGININSPMTGMVDFSLIPVYIIDELSLTHGAASMRDQSGGLGGVININNTPDWSKPFSLKYIQGIGSYDTYSEFIKLTYGSSQVQFKTSVYHNQSDNDYPFINRRIKDYDPATGEMNYRKVKNEQADYKVYGIMQEAYWKVTDHIVWKANYWGQKADRSIPTVLSYEGGNEANMNQQVDEDHKGVTETKFYFAQADLKLRLGYDSKDLHYSSQNYVPGKGLISMIDSKSKAKTYSGHIDFAAWNQEDLKFTASFSYDRNDVDTYESVNKTTYEENRDYFSLFCSLSKSFGERLNLNLMDRQDVIDGKIVDNVPYLGFDYRLVQQRDLILKGNITHNYHAPTLNDLYWQPGGNPDLKAEKGISGDLGIEYLFTKPAFQVKTELTSYYSDINDWIVWLPTFKGFWQPFNIKQVISYGLEYNLNISGQQGNFQYKLLGGYSYTRSKNLGDSEKWGDNSNGKQLIYVPLHSGNVLVDLRYKNSFIMYQWNHFSERFTTTSNRTIKRDWLYPYYMNNMTIGQRFDMKGCKLVAQLKINNLMDEYYRSILFRYMPGRNYLFTLMLEI